MKLDKLNFEILKKLRKNARISNSEIGRKIGLSSPAVAERIKKLEDAKIIKSYHTVIDYSSLGFQFQAIISLKVFMGRLKPFLKKVRQFDEVVHCHRITGNENIIMEVVLKDQKHLEFFIDQLINYGETKTHMVLSKLVENNLGFSDKIKTGNNSYFTPQKER